MNDLDPLQAYREKRDFRRTSEPVPGGHRTSGGPPIFVVQKHRASRLHYDLRLEVEGVLKSWAVPKGPSPNPRDRRLAVPTEDHPMAYADFEGIIPEGEYGGGTVMVWDRGTYHNLRAGKPGQEPVSMARALEEGQAEIELHGTKLRGAYALIRTGRGDRERWLLVKMRDDEASEEDLTDTRPESVLSGRTLDEIAADAGG